MEMQRLNTGMMERYEIENRRPGRVNAVQFGMGEALLGMVDRLIDDYNAQAAPEARVGLMGLEAGERGYADKLNAQDGMYTLIVRGYEQEEPVRREQVVQCLLRAGDAGALDGLAKDPNIAFAIVDDTEPARDMARRFIELRRASGLTDIPLIALGEGLEDARAIRALADSLAFRSEPDEAAKLCADMNYLDDMLYIAEPFARLTLANLPEALRERFSLDQAAGVAVGDLGDALRMKAEVFDAGIFLMAAPGWLNGCDTLRDCMTSERLRKFVGEAFTKELLPALSGMDRQAVERCVIESFERYENPLNRNRLLRAAGGLIGRFNRGPREVIARVAYETFEPPRNLAFALASTIMLYAGARQNPDTGVWEVVRGTRAEAIHDDPEVLARFGTLSHDMDPESLAYAVLADRELWQGRDLREIDGLEARVALDIAAMQRMPGVLPEEN